MGGGDGPAVLGARRESRLRSSSPLKQLDIAEGRLDQDAREVKTRFSKTFTTWFFPVEGPARDVLAEWVAHLRDTLLWSDSDPLFPATQMIVGPEGGFVAGGLKREAWSTAEPIRRIFRQAFERAGLPYFKPHSLRDTLVQFGEQTCRSLEEFKAWPQNLGHEKVMTTFSSYGAVASHRQAVLIRGLGRNDADPQEALNPRLKSLLAEVARELTVHVG